MAVHLVVVLVDKVAEAMFIGECSLPLLQTILLMVCLEGPRRAIQKRLSSC